MTLENLTAMAIEVGDLAVPLPMHASFSAQEAPTASVLKQSFISGEGSFLFWMRRNSVGPFLVMTPEAGTSLEYWERRHRGPKQEPLFLAYLHAAATGEQLQRTGGRWRQPLTSITLGPKAARELASDTGSSSPPRRTTQVSATASFKPGCST